MIKDVDYDAPMPECGLVRVYFNFGCVLTCFRYIQEEESRLWQPIPSRFIDISYSPTPGRVLSCFCAATSLGELHIC